MRRLMAAAMIAVSACSEPGARQAESAAESSVVPKGLRVRALPGGNGVLEVTALTLRPGEQNVELFAALKNVGDVPACHAAFSVELFDAREQSLAAGITGLLTQRFYRRTDGSGTIAACIGPGDRSMAAITDLTPELALSDVSSIVYRCPYSALDVEPIDGLTVECGAVVTRAAGSVYTGTLVNGFDVSVQRPSVTVFPVDAAGRPLGVALSLGDVQMPPGGSWAFETSSLGTAGADYSAYPAGALHSGSRMQ